MTLIYVYVVEIRMLGKLPIHKKKIKTLPVVEMIQAVEKLTKQTMTFKSRYKYVFGVIILSPNTY